MAIHFFEQEIEFLLADKAVTRAWIKNIVKQEGKKLGTLNYIFCSDRFLLNLNQQYLNHDTLTDIITFDNTDSGDRIEADIFISIDRVEENASNLDFAFDEELHRVIIHGLLHLFGYDDKTAAEKKLMREKEDACLSLR